MNANKQIAWECFSDPSYFDMWAVKQIHKKGFDDAFHVTSEVEARRLCALLNTLPAAAPVPAVPQGEPCGREVLAQVFSLCEDTENRVIHYSGSSASESFVRGRKFEAKGIRKAIGTWFQDQSKSTSPAQEPVVWLATRLWNARDLWTCPADIEQMLAAPSQEPGTCAQCKKPYRNGANTKGCPKCAPGLVVPESEFQKSISAQAPGTLTDEEKWSEFENRFIDAMREKEQVK